MEKKPKQHTLNVYNQKDVAEILGVYTLQFWEYCRDNNINIKQLSLKELVDLIIDYPGRKTPLGKGCI